ncbi:hypothetical protein GCM10022259_42210 [Aquimarina mytili]
MVYGKNLSSNVTFFGIDIILLDTHDYILDLAVVILGVFKSRIFGEKGKVILLIIV